MVGRECATLLALEVGVYNWLILYAFGYVERTVVVRVKVLFFVVFDFVNVISI